MTKMNFEKLTSLLIVIATSIVLGIVLLFTIGLGFALVYGIVTTLAVLCWLKFSYTKEPTDHSLLLPFYLLGIVLLLALQTIRYTSDFPNFLYEHYHYLVDPEKSKIRETIACFLFE